MFLEYCIVCGTMGAESILAGQCRYAECGTGLHCSQVNHHTSYVGQYGRSMGSEPVAAMLCRGTTAVTMYSSEEVSMEAAYFFFFFHY